MSTKPSPTRRTKSSIFRSGWKAYSHVAFGCYKSSLGLDWKYMQYKIGYVAHTLWGDIVFSVLYGAMGDGISLELLVEKCYLLSNHSC
jgi:hypothetical protein